jgi:hypothetical protein
VGCGLDGQLDDCAVDIETSLGHGRAHEEGAAHVHCHHFVEVGLGDVECSVRRSQPVGATAYRFEIAER